MINQSEIVRVDIEIGAMLALPAAEASRRIMHAYESSDRKRTFVAAMLGRLLLAAAHDNQPMDQQYRPQTADKA